jgi:hypothetical protein
VLLIDGGDVISIDARSANIKTKSSEARWSICGCQGLGRLCCGRCPVARSGASSAIPSEGAPPEPALAKGPAGGFVCERKLNRKGEDVGGLVPHLTLGSIANDEEPEMVIIVDRPKIADRIVRVSGPFTVEATIQAAMTLSKTPARLRSFHKTHVPISTA